jgi:hypothetical protein
LQNFGDADICETEYGDYYLDESDEDLYGKKVVWWLESSVADPDPPDPRVFGPPGSGSGSSSQRYGSGSGSFYHHAKIVIKTVIHPVL